MAASERGSSPPRPVTAKRARGSAATAAAEASPAVPGMQSKKKARAAAPEESALAARVAEETSRAPAGAEAIAASASAPSAPQVAPVQLDAAARAEEAPAAAAAAAARGRVCIDDLPSSVLSYALSFLELREQLRCARVSSYWRSLLVCCPDTKTLDLVPMRASLTDERLHALLAKFPHIESLNISSCVRLTNAALETVASLCPQLVQLNASGCVRLTDVSPLRRCRQLEVLQLWACKNISAASVAALEAACPALKTPLL